MYFMHLGNASVEGTGAGENGAWAEKRGWFMFNNICAMSPAAPYRDGRIVRLTDIMPSRWGKLPVPSLAHRHPSRQRQNCSPPLPRLAGTDPTWD